MKIKKELKAVEVRVCCAGKEFSTCINDLSSSLRKSELYFPQQENSSAKINTHVSNQQLNFRKNIDAEIQKIKNSLQCIREMYSLHNACAVDLWNQRQGDFFEMERNTEDLFKSLTQFQEDLPKMYNDAFPSDYDYYYNSLKDSKENDENMHCQLKDFHNKMKCAVRLCAEENQKLVDKEEKEINHLLKILFENAKRNFDSTLFETETTSKYVSKELENMQKQISSSYFDSKEKIRANLSLVPEVERCSIQLQSVPQNVLLVSDRCLNLTSEVNAVKTSEMNLLDLSMSNLNAAATFTPNRVVKKLNSPEERKKLIDRIQKVVSSEVQMNFFKTKAFEK
ncbi:uncharacterized protein LOC129233151 [Uloborus diversus]|uniref:uncharacterized protein LOC129233151 n=2 Tax=Uloborus diversus TaxID=327109 RepID=UPI0024092D57|nr:uncharacterized protein LOC129233151 [Uloborus diversus]